jgi:triosephosphate isomerase (TIM)
VSPTSRRPLVVGNWKQHNGVAASEALARAVAAGVSGIATVDVVVAPVFTALHAVGKALAGTSVALGAQDVHWEDKGAFTGEVGAPMLVDVGCRYGIVGHSERRAYFGDSDANVKKKATALLRAGITPIVCVGESLAEREAGRTLDVVRSELDAVFSGEDAPTLSRCVVAYEPVWAIGTGKVATPEDAQAVHAFIRSRLAETVDAASAAGIAILYGGSVKPENAGDLIAEADIDGALVGGASLDAAGFAAIVRAAQPV